jgi:hypothetical protein
MVEHVSFTNIFKHLTNAGQKFIALIEVFLVAWKVLQQFIFKFATASKFSQTIEGLAALRAKFLDYRVVAETRMKLENNGSQCGLPISVRMQQSVSQSASK